MGKLDTSYKAKMQQVAELTAEVRALRSQVAVLESEILAGRAEVEDYKQRWQTGFSAHLADRERHAELVRLVREYFAATAEALMMQAAFPGTDDTQRVFEEASDRLKAAVRGDPGASGSGEGA